MAEAYEVRVKVISLKGHCVAGHKVGDEWVISNKTPEGICLPAFNSLMPNLWMLRFGGTFPWETNSDRAISTCPDGNNPVVFELTRLRK